MRDATIRRCSDECWFFKNGGTGCQYYEKGSVKFGEVCEYDLVRIKLYAEAFRDGNTDQIKGDASKITALVMMQIEQMLQQVTIEGTSVLEPILDGKGCVVYIPDPDWDQMSGQERMQVPAMRICEHPLIARAIQLMRSMGINLEQFKLTPKSADEKPQVAGHIIVDKQINITQVMSDREVTEKRFAAAMLTGTQMTKEDPVYQKLLEQGDIKDGS